jgi:hypothetical protein
MLWRNKNWNRKKKRFRSRATEWEGKKKEEKKNPRNLVASYSLIGFERRVK